MRKLLSLILMTTMAVGLAACGSKDENKERTVKIVVAMPDFQIGQGVLDGMQIALDEVNNQVGNTHIEVVNLKTTSPEETYSADLEVAAANQAADDKDVVAYIGMSTSGQAKAAIPVLNQAGIASLSMSATWPGLTKTGFGAGEPGIYYPSGSRTFFRIVTSDEVQGAAGAYLANELGYKKACLLDDGQTYGAGVVGIFDLIANDLGIEIVCREEYDPTLMSVDAYADVAARIAEVNPDVVYIGGNAFQGGAEMIVAIHQQKSDLPIIGPDGFVNADKMLEFSPDLIEGFYATDVMVPAAYLDSAVGTQFVTAFEQKYGRPPQPFAIVAYEAMRVVLRGIEKAKNPNRGDVLKALRDLGDYSGALGSWTFDANGDTTLSAICVWQIQDGQWKFVKRSDIRL